MLLSKASSVLTRTGKRRAAPTVKRTGMSMLRASQNRVNQPLLTLSSNSSGGRYQGWKQDGHYPGEPVFVA